MPLEVELTRRARLDIDAGFEWYLERSPNAAESFLREVDRGVALVVEAPGVWPTFEGAQRYVLNRFPYSLIYTVEGHVVVVHAVAHQSRRPGYWKDT